MGKSMVTRIVIAVVVVLGIVGYRVFFVDSAEVGKFNDTLVDMIAQANARFEPFVGHLQQYAQGAEMDVELMAQARDELEKSIKGDHDLLKLITVPEDELCSEFHAECLAYVENSLQLVEKYKEVIDYMSEHNPGNEADVNAIADLLAELGNKDEKLLEAVIACQERVAEKFDLKLE